MKEIICKKCGEKNDYGYVRCEQCGAKLNYDESYVAKSEEDNQVESTFDTFDSFFVNITVSEAEEIIKKSNLGLSFTISGESIIELSPEKRCIVLMVEKYFRMVDNYVAGTIIIDNVEGKTRIQVLTAGGGTGMLGTDLWGREDKFRDQIESVFEKYC